MHGQSAAPVEHADDSQSEARLRRHGLALDNAALDDTERTLLGHRRALRSRMARTLRRLDEVLDDLEQALPA